MGETILTLHPEGKAGVNIDKAKYDLIRQIIINTIRDHQLISFKELTIQVKRRLAGPFEGSISWYVTTVKLDLEARGEIERVARKGPQQLRLTKS